METATDSPSAVETEDMLRAGFTTGISTNPSTKKKIYHWGEADEIRPASIAKKKLLAKYEIEHNLI